MAHTLAKIKVRGELVQKIVKTNGRTDTTDFTTFLANAVGNYRRRNTQRKWSLKPSSHRPARPDPRKLFCRVGGVKWTITPNVFTVQTAADFRRLDSHHPTRQDSFVGSGWVGRCQRVLLGGGDATTTTTCAGWRCSRAACRRR